MENLNKENFWDELYKKYPKGMKRFCDFIDEYKKNSDWNSLFTHSILGGIQLRGKPNIKCDIKFHDIPFEMQIGIIEKFLFDNGLHICKSYEGEEWKVWLKSFEDEECEFPLHIQLGLRNGIAAAITDAIKYMNNTI